MRGPGYAKHPEHSVVVTASKREWVAERDGTELARTQHAVELQETGYPLRVYFPPEAVRRERFSESANSTYCPFKGQASYLAIDGEDVAWTYATPYDEVGLIAGYVAFYPERVSVRDCGPAA